MILSSLGLKAQTMDQLRWIRTSTQCGVAQVYYDEASLIVASDTITIIEFVGLGYSNYQKITSSQSNKVYFYEFLDEKGRHLSISLTVNMITKREEMTVFDQETFQRIYLISNQNICDQ